VGGVRDVDARAEAALRDARDFLRREQRCGGLDAGKEWDPDATLFWDAVAQLMDGMALSEDVRAYLLRVLEVSEISRPRGRRANMIRDTWILYTIAMIVEKHGIRPTQNREPAVHSKTANCPSACAIVAQALRELGIGFAVRGVEDIWRRRDQIRAACK
jgi:hypothetical protein